MTSAARAPRSNRQEHPGAQEPEWQTADVLQDLEAGAAGVGEEQQDQTELGEGEEKPLVRRPVRLATG